MTSPLNRLSSQRRREYHKLRALADKIIATAESHHQANTSVPTSQLSTPDKNSIHSHNKTLEYLKRTVQRAVGERDLDALKAYDRFDTEGRSYKLSNLQRVIEDLRYAGHQDTSTLINQEMLDRAANMWLALFDEGYDQQTALYGGKITDETRDPYLRTLRVVCLTAPDDIATYIISNKQWAMNLVGERLISDHEELVRVVRSFMDSETPVLAEGML